MLSAPTRAALLTAGAMIALPQAAFAATEAAAAATSPADAAADQSTTANQAGQANDKGSLSHDDIIVTGTALAQTAPITVSLKTTQPQAAVSREYIDSSAAPSADFFELIALTPGVSLTGTGNGLGFSESKAQIRGFQDGEYNVTYDSVPFADTNNPTHHSTAFFPTNTIETVVVDRGPGNASQLGQATYGGNINIYSRAVSAKRGGQFEVTGGSFETIQLRGELQTGKIASLNDAQLVVTGQFVRSDGALTNSPINSKNAFAKLVLPIGSANTLTVMSTYNRNFYYSSDTAKGATCGSATVVGSSTTAVDAAGNPLLQLTGDNCAPSSDIALYGINFGMTNNPALASHFKYNRTDKTTDFTIVRLQSKLAEGLTFDNRLYMYGYTNNTNSGNGSVTVTAANNLATFTQKGGTVVTGFSGLGTVASPYKAISGPATDISGYFKLNKYRNFGYIGQLNYAFPKGEVRIGGWFEHSISDRETINFDLTTAAPNFNQAFNANGTGTLPSISLANISYLQHSGWDQFEAFGEFEYRPIEAVVITPGIKYVNFHRFVVATVNQTSRSPIDTGHTWTKTLPFLTANWAITPAWSAYFQYAQGMYVPDISSFYTPTNTTTDAATQATNLANLKPQTTTNYQVGTVWHGRSVSLDFDGYVINVNNKIAADPTIGTPGGPPSGTLINIGQVKYKGVEGQVTISPITGLTLLANASYNKATSVATGTQIAKTPYYTATLGAFYNHRGFRMSYSQKFTGHAYSNEFSGYPVARLYRIDAYSVGDFAASYDFGRIRVGVTVNNVLDNRAITAIGTSGTGAPKATVNGVSYQSGYGQLDAFSFLPPRSTMVDVRVKF
jgi:iron complex outermembrane receptor protein